MALLLSYTGGDSAFWRRGLEAQVPGLEVRVYPDVGDRGQIELAVTWKHPFGDLATYPNLKAILSLGAGVEHVLGDPSLPDHVTVVRLIDDVMTHDMAMHALHWALHFHRGYHVCRADQAVRRWQKRKCPEMRDRRGGGLGVGEVGAEAARRLCDAGFSVAGWSRTAKAIDGVENFHGSDDLDPFLNRTEIVASFLPLTRATEGLLDARRLAALPRGAFVINLSRGGIVDDQALIAALDSGHIEAAALDVFRVEPLPADHPFWTHPRISITPHAAGHTYDRTALVHVAGNVRKILAGERPHPAVDRALGY